jgi:hypothetical protein
MLMRKEVLTIAGYFHEGLIQLQDWEYWARIAGQGLRLGIMPERLVRYRRHPGNLSSEGRSRASERELFYLYRTYFDHPLPRILREAFKDILDLVETPDLSLHSDEIGCIYLSHRNPLVRSMFSDRMIDVRNSHSSRTSGRMLPFAEYFRLLNEKV